MEKELRILFADDDDDTQLLVGSIMQKAGITTLRAKDGSQAIELWRENPVDLIILDVCMPVLDGVEACRQIRQVSAIPIILLTAKGQEQDVITGLEAGADDYIVKPFRPGELLARIRAILQRGARLQTPGDNLLICGDLSFNPKTKQLIQRGKPVSLTPIELRLMQYMMQHVGVALSKADLLSQVWGWVDSNADTNLIEAAIKRLRKKIEPDPGRPQYIKTVWGTGYRFGEQHLSNS